jgi:hypothetical protein
MASLSGVVRQLSKERNRLEDELHRVTAALAAFGRVYISGRKAAAVAPSQEANHFGCGSQEDRSGAAGKVGEGEGSTEESGVESAEAITRIVLRSCSSENCRQLCCLSSMPRLEACAPVRSSGELPLLPSRGWLVRVPRLRFLA